MMDFFFTDFHMHSFLSDGILLPVELIRFAVASGRQVVAVTDHVSESTLERVIREIKADVALAEKYWGVTAIAGVELTNIPAGADAPLAAKARTLGAELVVVHGETGRTGGTRDQSGRGQLPGSGYLGPSRPAHP